MLSTIWSDRKAVAVPQAKAEKGRRRNSTDDHEVDPNDERRTGLRLGARGAEELWPTSLVSDGKHVPEHKPGGGESRDYDLMQLMLKGMTADPPPRIDCGASENALWFPPPKTPPQFTVSQCGVRYTAIHGRTMPNMGREGSHHQDIGRSPLVVEDAGGGQPTHPHQHTKGTRYREEEGNEEGRARFQGKSCPSSGSQQEKTHRSVWRPTLVVRLCGCS